MIQIDDTQRDQQPGERQCAQRLDAHPETPGHRREQQGGERLDQRIARADGRAAVPAASPQRQIAQNGNVLPGTQAVVAMRTARGRMNNAGGFRQACLFGQPQGFTRIPPPAMGQPRRQPQDNDIEEAADEQSQHQDGADP